MAMLRKGECDEGAAEGCARATPLPQGAQNPRAATDSLLGYEYIGNGK
jgi:hypothetical protein